jgi:hypothetical protein
MGCRQFCDVFGELRVRWSLDLSGFHCRRTKGSDLGFLWLEDCLRFWRGVGDFQGRSLLFDRISLVFQQVLLAASAFSLIFANLPSIINHFHSKLEESLKFSELLSQNFMNFVQISLFFTRFSSDSYQILQELHQTSKIFIRFF